MALDLPNLKLLLKPNFEGDKVLSLSVRLTIELPSTGANQLLVSLDHDAASTPTLRYASEAISSFDACGALPLESEDGDEAGVRNYMTTRSTEGDVFLDFVAKPLDGENPSPILDFRTEHDGAGLMGSGLCFLPLPRGGEYSLSLKWDLRDAPPGTRAISSLGEGTVRAVGSAELLGDSFYAVGQVQSFPDSDLESNCSVYWFGELPSDILQSSSWVRRLFRKMHRFFCGDEEENVYRLFARRIPEPDGMGGAALTRSFLFFYSDSTTASDLEGLFAHEMVHNWPTMTGTFAETAWYIEGVAEYYSIVLLYRFGMHTLDQFLDKANSLARDYYTNPFIGISNQAQDTESQASNSSALEFLPYTRGAMFLIRIDALIRAKSNGSRSLDHVVLALLDRSRKKQSHALEDFLGLLAQEIGPQARMEYRHMADGKVIEMPEGALGTIFSVEEVRLPLQRDTDDCGYHASEVPGNGAPTLSMVTAFQWRKNLETPVETWS